MREPSEMVILPFDVKEIADPKTFIANLQGNESVRISNLEFDKERGMLIDFLVDKELYHVTIDIIDVDIPEFIRPKHVFTDEEIEILDNVRDGLSVTMEYRGRNLKCFHDQLRIIHAMFPKVLAVLDSSSEKVLSGKWVALAAESKVLPTPNYLFTVQAVSGDDDEIWLHTHGLKRCGLYELEILYSDRENYSEHYRIIETYAYRMLDDDEIIKPGEPVFIAETADTCLVCTAVDWKEALKFYPKAQSGTKEDREDGYHSEDTYVLMRYEGPDDADEKNYVPVQTFNPYLEDNPMYWLSTEETERMSALAIERLPFLIKAFKSKTSGVDAIIVKIGIVTDKEHWNDDDEPLKEHLWFELKGVNENSVEAELTQDAYYIDGLKEGYTGTYSFDSITDWIIFRDGERITPDDVYRL